ncbi:winged helix-turn-helix transcriptional regulator [Roseibium sp.]|uniref:winged helix-turn-helix transcriptional regulator n=1 Tax=Roseibium sp. TaxID=1936156 RepID=UPI003D0B5A35
MDGRSGCAINLSIEVLGDRWSMIILRDIMFGNFRSYRELLTHSLEGIATNILAARLKHLEAEGLVTIAADPQHKQRKIYSLTEKSIALVPVLAQLGAWGVRFLSPAPELAVRARVLAEGGPDMWEDFMDELREIHLGIARPAGSRSVLAELQDAYLAELQKIEAARKA